MRDKETNSIAETRPASAWIITHLFLAAERELASFYGAIERKYGPEEARKAADDWIDEVETMEWPLDGVLPNWRRVTIVAADRLAYRVLQHTPNL
jgi:hypothetical protein